MPPSTSIFRLPSNLAQTRARDIEAEHLIDDVIGHAHSRFAADLTIRGVLIRAVAYVCQKKLRLRLEVVPSLED